MTTSPILILLGGVDYTKSIRLVIFIYGQLAVSFVKAIISRSCLRVSHQVFSDFSLIFLLQTISHM